MRIERRSEGRKLSEGEAAFLAIGWLSIAAAACVVLLKLPIACTFKTSIGLPCPACGSTRSLVALGRGDVLAAVRMNPVVALIYFAILALTLQLLAGRFVPALRFHFVLAESEWPGFVAILSAVLLCSWAFLIADGR